MAPTARLPNDRRIDPQHRGLVQNSSVLIAQLALLGASGLAFWVVVANRFAIGDVGEVSGLVAVTNFVTYLTTLGLPVTVTRFGSNRNAQDDAVFSCSMLLTVASSAVGSLFVILISSARVMPTILSHGRVVGFGVLFSGVAGSSVVVLIDYRQLRLGGRRQVLLRSALVAVLRLGTIIVLPVAAGPFWMWVSITAAAPVGALLTYPGWRRDCPVDVRRSLPTGRRRLLTFTAANWVSLLLMQAPFYAFPVIVVASLAKEQRGVFYIVWSITSVLFMVPQLTGRVLLMEAAGHEPQIRGQAWFSLKLSLIVVAAIMVVSVPVAFLIPVLYGQAYESGRLLLIVLVAGLVPFSVTNTAINFARA